MQRDPHLLVFGNGQSGKSALLRTYMSEVTRLHTPETAQLFVVDYRRAHLGEFADEWVADYATNAATAAELAGGLAEFLKDRLPGGDVTPEQLRNRSWWEGREAFVVIDDYELVATSQGNPLEPLVPLLAQAVDIGLHLVVARRTGGAGRLYDNLITALRDLAQPGMLLVRRPHGGGPHRPAARGARGAGPGPDADPRRLPPRAGRLDALRPRLLSHPEPSSVPTPSEPTRKRRVCRHHTAYPPLVRGAAGAQTRGVSCGPSGAGGLAGGGTGLPVDRPCVPGEPALLPADEGDPGHDEERPDPGAVTVHARAHPRTVPAVAEELAEERQGRDDEQDDGPALTAADRPLEADPALGCRAACSHASR